MAVLGYLPKLKGGVGLAFGVHFLHDFSIKIFFINILSTSKVSVSCLFSFPRYQKKCVIKFLFRQLMMSQTIRFMVDQPLKQWLTGRKRGEDGNLNISRTKRAF